MAEEMENILPDGNTAAHPERRKRRYKYRYKKKRSKKKKIKKYLEYLIWVLVIAAFISSLVILVKQMDNDEANKKKKKKGSLTLPVNSQQVCKLQTGYIISQDKLT